MEVRVRCERGRTTLFRIHYARGSPDRFLFCLHLNATTKIIGRVLSVKTTRHWLTTKSQLIYVRFEVLRCTPFDVRLRGSLKRNI